MPATPVVLDSFALLAYFRGEEGGLAVRDLLDKAAAANRPLHMSDVNYAEMKYILLKKDGSEAWQQAEEVLRSLCIDYHPTSLAQSNIAADFKARFKISLADAFAAALAKEMKAELVTGDPEFKVLEREIKIAWMEG